MLNSLFTHIMNMPRVSSLGPKLSAALAAGILLAAGGSGVTLRGQDPARAASDEFQQTVLPVLSKNCLSCHSDRVHAGGLTLEAFKNDPSLIGQKHDVWVKVLDKVKAGTMPPRTSAPLTPQEMTAITGWVERTFGAAASASGAPRSEGVEPGRVTARRLNRAE